MGKTYFVDFFNTTVYRTASAKDVLFEFAEALGGRCSVEPAAIYCLFLKHQRSLAFEKYYKTREAEYTFEEVISRVGDDLFRPFGGLGKEEFLKLAPDVYFQTELNGLRLNKELVSLLLTEKTQGGGVLSCIAVLLRKTDDKGVVKRARRGRSIRRLFCFLRLRQEQAARHAL